MIRHIKAHWRLKIIRSKWNFTQYYQLNQSHECNKISVRSFTLRLNAKMEGTLTQEHLAFVATQP